MDLVLLFDGLCEPRNPGGTGAWGFVLWLGTKQCIKNSGALPAAPWMTNNYAEYCALGFGIKQIIDLNLPKITSLLILGDSQLVVHQMTGKWQMKAARLTPLNAKCKEYLEAIGTKFGIKTEIHWIPRSLNRDADAMSNEGYTKQTGMKVISRHPETEEVPEPTADVPVEEIR